MRLGLGAENAHEPCPLLRAPRIPCAERRDVKGGEEARRKKSRKGKEEEEEGGGQKRAEAETRGGGENKTARGEVPGN